MPADREPLYNIESILESLRAPAWAAKVDALRAAAATLGSGTLEEAHEKRFIRPLAEAAADEKWEVRKEAVAALAECRHHGKVVHGRLEELAGDANRWVSQAAERAMKRMRARANRAKQWELTPAAQNPMLEYIMARIREIGLRSMTPARIYELAMEVGERSYRELAAETAHEIRSLLTPCEGALAQLRRHLAARGTDATADRCLETALGRLEQINVLTNDLRTYSVPSTADFAPVDVAAVVQDAVAIGHDSGEDSEQGAPTITRVIDVPGGLIIDALRDRLMRAIANLVANACQAMPKGGTLTVRARHADAETIAIDIADTGRGMSPDDIDEARVRFSSTRRDQGGTGLGLPIAQRIVEGDHRGELLIESTPNIGTTVTLILPVRRSNDE